MTLEQLSLSYAAAADKLTVRIRELRHARTIANNSEERHAIDQRIAALLPMLQDTRAVAAMLKHYYTGGKHR